MSTDTLISPRYIQLFNQAATLARESRFEDSLAVWETLLGKQDGKGVMTGDFLGQAMMRKAWVLMDLERWQQAREVLEDKVLEACLGQFSTANLYEYFFSYANVLGNLRQINEMDRAFSFAMRTAADGLSDHRRMRTCWNNLFFWAEKAKAWKFLQTEAAYCVTYARNEGDEQLETIAKLNRAMALHRQGRKEKAARIVQPIRKRAQRDNNAEVLRRCEEALKEEAENSQ